ncbi:energy transducer TonB [Pseudomonas otitidis]|uniref:energy transducer TonB n=1 Tax=Metapseudomonas otitidis TaxID=319939 RepID=UPI002E7B8E36|nr:energy transducer TonB [Pseudomonas otitidis]MEE1891532.1 energy transducer TonB [Pseudomonas otitidis]
MSQAKRNLSWAISLLVVLGLHVALFCWALFWKVSAEPIELPPPAMMVQLEPLPAPTPPPAPPPPPQVEPEPEPLPKLAEAPKPTIAIAPKPKPKPKPPKPKPPEPKPEQKPQEQESPKEQVAAPTPPAPPSDAKPAAQQESMASAMTQARETWQSQLLTHLAKYKRYPEDARRRNIEGVNRLSFTVDAEGKVLAYALTGKSGSASLDRATLEMIRRAQPLPPPPPEILVNGTREVTAPFVYSLRKDRR